MSDGRGQAYRDAERTARYLRMLMNELDAEDREFITAMITADPGACQKHVTGDNCVGFGSADPEIPGPDEGGPS